MIIADTSVWIEFLKGHEPHFSVFRSALEQRKIFALEAVFAELLQGVRNKREESIVLSYWENTPRYFEDELLIQAGLTSHRKKLLNKGVGLIDATLIYAAEKSGVQLWTLDKKILAVLKKELRFQPSS
jgi:predicted nucleic acid-binding protein